MVKRKDGGKRSQEQGQNGGQARRAPKRTTITPDTPYGECSERLTAFGGLLALVKFLDLIGFEKAFEVHYVHPKREPKLGGYRMVLGMLMLLFIGFQRLGHFTYVRTDAMVCGILRVAVLPAVSTFWRYLTSLGIVQSASLLRLGATLRSNGRARATTRNIAARKGCDRYCAFWRRPGNISVVRNGEVRLSATRKSTARFGNFESSYQNAYGKCIYEETVNSSDGIA